MFATGRLSLIDTSFANVAGDRLLKTLTSMTNRGQNSVAVGLASILLSLNPSLPRCRVR